jgi:colanic acid biosynthesis glycosyl transferase WcaI
MKIVFINRYFSPDISATSQILSDLAFHLASQGNEVHVICSRQLYEDARCRLPASDELQGVFVHRVWTTAFGRASLIGRAADYLCFYVFACATLLFLADSRTVVVAKTDPPMIAVPASAIAAFRRARFVNWIQDLFPEVATALDVLPTKPGVRSILKALRTRALLAADANVVIGSRMADLVWSFGVSLDRLTVIPNWSDVLPGSATVERTSEMRGEWHQAGRFVVMYSGNMGRAHDFETALDAALQLRERSDISFLWVGGGARKSWIVQEAQSQGIRSFFFQDYQSRDRLPDSLSVASVHLISLRPELEGLIVPSKFYGILAVGRPTIFIGDTDGELARIIKEHDVGMVVAQGDASRLAEALCVYADDPALVARQGNAAARLAREHYNRSVALAAWEALLTNVSARSL